MIEHNGYCLAWQDGRIEYMVKLFGVEFFSGKSILELGSFNGYIGHRFYEMGAIVHCVEGRQENVDYIKSTYPHLTVELANLDTPEWTFGDWDIIINFGLYYHLEYYHKEQLINCSNHCRWLFFETVVFDSDEDEIFFRHEEGQDQSLSQTGGNPSTKFVENILISCNTSFTKHVTPELSKGGHDYHWEDKNSKQLNPCNRRFWTVEKKEK